ncbi:MAG: UDP-glucose 4-epimerase GalE [Chloroflexi bacterium]|nr:UDP-glucose 4-epimerase GalE [Chloroflexota bacterium]
MKILITGGAGYIGSTIYSALEDHGYKPIILDSLTAGDPNFTIDKNFYHGDIGNSKRLDEIFADHPDIDVTIHCAASIIVPESMDNPSDYYNNNVINSIKLLDYLKNTSATKIIFSSTASIYSGDDGGMVTEDSHLSPKSPYSKTKLAVEMAIKDYCHAYDIRGISLRYFNPIGADPKMRSGPSNINPSHIIGKLSESSQKSTSTFHVTGSNWPTRDGTGIRDYIHVWDVALAHVRAVQNFNQIVTKSEPYSEINIGSGEGTTVMELITAFEEVSGKKIDVLYKPARPGDVAGAYTNRDKAKQLLDWEPKFSIEQGIADFLKWLGKETSAI